MTINFFSNGRFEREIELSNQKHSKELSRISTPLLFSHFHFGYFLFGYSISQPHLMIQKKFLQLKQLKFD
ncbi:hypothetical protein DERF_011518 [Dermatophagoides farinae]|uniref:Uncharacterized protein n=1 Tax=Dermatophagoides farinae TaxID=6954 RepID=A0A922HW91_DERFA|nr:hypothetical protein DERF_011518 [Dermatophagoides farinae]